MADPAHVELVKRGAEAIRQWREEHPKVQLELHRADLRGATLHGAHLHGADLETVRFTPAGDSEGADLGNDAQFFETSHRPWPERWLDWERLRVVGRLPLFGVSYTVLLLIPIVFYGLALYNDKIDLARAWAAQAVPSPDHPLHRLPPLLLERLHPRPLPSQSLLLLISTVLLAVGSTLYTFFCPSRVKEFSRDQWRDQLGRSLLHYWPLAWKHRYIGSPAPPAMPLGCWRLLGARHQGMADRAVHPPALNLPVALAVISEGQDCALQ
jgi:hypothetical protein